MSKLLYVIQPADLRCAHTGLATIIKSKVSKLKSGDIIAFINSKRDKVKVLGILHDGETDSSVMAYYRSPSGRISAESIQYIPEVFGGGKLDMAEATRKGLVDLLGSSH